MPEAVLARRNAGINPVLRRRHHFLPCQQARLRHACGRQIPLARQTTKPTLLGKGQPLFRLRQPLPRPRVRRVNAVGRQRARVRERIAAHNADAPQCLRVDALRGQSSLHIGALRQCRLPRQFPRLVRQNIVRLETAHRLGATLPGIIFARQFNVVNMAVQLRDKIQRPVLRTRCAVHPPFAHQQAAVRRVLQPIRQQVFGIMSQPFVRQAFGCRLPIPAQKQAESLVAQ